MMFLCPNIQLSNLSPFQDVKLTILTFSGYWLKNVSRGKLKSRNRTIFISCKDLAMINTKITPDKIIHLEVFFSSKYKFLYFWQVTFI